MPCSVDYDVSFWKSELIYYPAAYLFKRIAEHP